MASQWTALCLNCNEVVKQVRACIVTIQERLKLPSVSKVRCAHNYVCLCVWCSGVCLCVCIVHGTSVLFHRSFSRISMSVCKKTYDAKFKHRVHSTHVVSCSYVDCSRLLRTRSFSRGEVTKMESQYSTHFTAPPCIRCGVQLKVGLRHWHQLNLNQRKLDCKEYVQWWRMHASLSDVHNNTTTTRRALLLH